MKIYFGAPLFSDMEREYNAKMVEQLRMEFPNIEIYLPQENDAINDKSGYADSRMIAKADTDELLSSDVLIAVLDGQVMDVGLASEIGIAYANGISIIGLYTDSRQGTYGNTKKIDALDQLAESQFSYVNLYTIGLIKDGGQLVNSIDGVIQVLKDFHTITATRIQALDLNVNEKGHFFVAFKNGKEVFFESVEDVYNKTPLQLEEEVYREGEDELEFITILDKPDLKMIDRIIKLYTNN